MNLIRHGYIPLGVSLSVNELFGVVYPTKSDCFHITVFDLFLLLRTVVGNSARLSKRIPCSKVIPCDGCPESALQDRAEPPPGLSTSPGNVPGWLRIRIAIAEFHSSFSTRQRNLLKVYGNFVHRPFAHGPLTNRHHKVSLGHDEACGDIYLRLYQYQLAS